MFAIMTTIRCARSEVGLSRLPVTEEIAGSNPVGRAIESVPRSGAFSMVGLFGFCYNIDVLPS